MKGQIVAWTNKAGERCTGVMAYEDQIDEYISQGKVFIRTTNLPIKDEDGCWMVNDSPSLNMIISKEKLTLIGFID